MSYSPSKICKYELARADLLQDVQDKLVHAFLEAAEAEGLTVSTVAERLGKHKSFVSRRLKSPHNITLETLSDLITAMESRIDIEIYPKSTLCAAGANWQMSKPGKMKVVKARKMNRTDAEGGKLYEASVG